MFEMYCSWRWLGSPPIASDVLPLGRVVDVGEARIVELQIAAAQRVGAAQLFGVGRGQVVPEVLHVGIYRLLDRGVAAAVVDHAGRGDRQLRGLPGIGVVAQEGERVREDGLADTDLAANPHRGGRVVVLALVVAELHVEHLAGDLLDPLERVDEIHVPRGPSKLAVGDRLQTGLALELDHPDDRLVLGLPQVLASIRPDLKSARARSNSGGRRRLPTWSARNGGSGRELICLVASRRPAFPNLRVVLPARELHSCWRFVGPAQQTGLCCQGSPA